MSARESLFSAPDRIDRRGGDGPEQPVWLNVQTYSVEWYRLYRAWHLERWPDADAVTRANLAMLVEVAEERDRYRIEADRAMREYDMLEYDYARLREERDALRVRTGQARTSLPHDYSGMGF